MEPVIATAEVKQKLQSANLGQYHFNEFCRVLALRLNDETTPLGFLMAFELLKIDMANGNGRDIRGVGEPIPTTLSGLPIGGVMNLMLPAIVKHAFPEEFAQQIMTEYKAVLADAAAARG